MNEIRNYMKGLKRTMQGSTSPFSVDAITPDIIDKIAENKKIDNFYDTRDMAAFSIQFEGMLRISEITNITCNDILFDNEKLAIQVRRTKTDQFGEGRQILIYKSNSKHSAYNWLTCYLKLRNSNSEFLFISKNGAKISPRDLRERLKKSLEEINAGDRLFSTHSLRKGGAQTAAYNGACFSAIQYQGGWKISCFLKYTELTPQQAAQNLKGKT